MKRSLKYIALAMIVAFVMVGCAKQPTQEINDSKTAIESAKEAGAETYLSEDLKNVEEKLVSAMDEIKIQDEKIFKNYDNAKKILAEIKADAETIKESVPAKKEEAKNLAVTAQSDAQTTITEAGALLEKAPKGKDTKAELEAMKNDLKGLEESLPEVQGMIDGENYFGASDKAKAICDQAKGISDEINAAIEKKTGGKK